MTTIRYIRWSSLEQGNADRSSEDRQRAITDAYASRAGLTYDETLIDRGKSAFTGANITTGELGKLAKRIEAGSIANPVLVIEELDRLSRRPPSEMLTWLVPLLSRGLVLHIASSGQVIDQTALNRDFGSFIQAMSAAFSAFDFSRKQQERGAASWTKRRDAAAAGQNLSRHRARKWLEWNAETKTYLPIGSRVELIREMFDLRLTGHGKQRIAKLFNERAKTEERYKVWPSTKAAPAAWTASAVGRIVQDRAVCGYVQYTRYPRGADKRIPLGQPVRVYPAIIDDETFALANGERLDNQRKYQGRGKAISNLFGRVARCGACGSQVSALGSSRWRTRKDGSLSQHYFLYCKGAKVDKTCVNQRGWPYAPIESAVIDVLLGVAIDDIHFRSDDAAAIAEARVAKLRQQETREVEGGRRILRLVMDGDELAHDEYEPSKGRLAHARAELKEAEAELGRALGQVSPAEHISRVAALRQRLDNEDSEVKYEARSLVKAALGELINQMHFGRNGAVHVTLKSGLGAFMILDGKVTHAIDGFKMGSAEGQRAEAFSRQISPHFEQ